MVTQPSLLANALIVVGESFWVFSAAAQLRRLIKTRNVHGLSAVTQTLNAAGNVGWCAYFGMNHLWFPFATNALLLLVTITIIGLTLGNRRQFAHGVITVIIVGPLTALILVSMPGAAGWLAMSYNIVSSIPWFMRVVGRKKTSGISAHSLWFAVAAMIFTLTYALLIHSAPLVAGCSEGLLYEAVIVRYYYHHYRRHY